MRIQLFVVKAVVKCIKVCSIAKAGSAPIHGIKISDNKPFSHSDMYIPR